MLLRSSPDLGRCVRERRRAMGLNQTDLAARAGVSRRWLSDLETGKPTIEVGLTFRVFAALGLSIEARPEPAGVIRAAEARDVAAMQAIEVAAGRVFATVGMDAIAEDRPFPAEVLLRYLRDGRAWVAVDDADRAVAYLLADWVDGNAHVEQVSVDPAHSRRGIGAALIERAARWGAERGAPALTLTTFAEVAWNAPYYERLGFRRLDDAELEPEMRRVRAEEAEHGLERWPRVSMRKALNDA
jgi:y4mF family transcriptional regulator